MFPTVTSKPFCIVVDVMSQQRKIPAKNIKTFQEMCTTVLNMSVKSRKPCRVDFVLDSYLEGSIKQGRRERRKMADPIELLTIDSSTCCPVQMETFWASSRNKELLQKFF